MLVHSIKWTAVKWHLRGMLESFKDISIGSEVNCWLCQNIPIKQRCGELGNENILRLSKKRERKAKMAAI